MIKYCTNKLDYYNCKGENNKNTTVTKINKSENNDDIVEDYENKQNCAFSKDNKWFRYRAAAIIVENDCVLFASNEKEDIYYSIGGAIHHGETAEQAVLREVYEETGINYQIDYLAVIHEWYIKRLRLP